MMSVSVASRSGIFVTMMITVLRCVICISTSQSSFFSVDALCAMEPSSRQDNLSHAGAGVVAAVDFPRATFATGTTTNKETTTDAYTYAKATEEKVARVTNIEKASWNWARGDDISKLIGEMKQVLKVLSDTRAHG